MKRPKMILVKNFNIFFIISIVVISNLINGAQFNETPTGSQQQNKLEDSSSDINVKQARDANRHMSLGNEKLDPGMVPTSTNENNVKNFNGKEDIDIDDMTDLKGLSEQARKELFTKGQVDASKKNNLEDETKTQSESDKQANPEKDTEIKKDLSKESPKKKPSLNRLHRGREAKNEKPVEKKVSIQKEETNIKDNVNDSSNRPTPAINSPSKSQENTNNAQLDKDKLKKGESNIQKQAANSDQKQEVKNNTVDPLKVNNQTKKDKANGINDAGRKTDLTNHEKPKVENQQLNDTKQGIQPETPKQEISSEVTNDQDKSNLQKQQLKQENSENSDLKKDKITEKLPAGNDQKDQDSKPKTQENSIPNQKKVPQAPKLDNDESKLPAKDDSDLNKDQSPEKFPNENNQEKNISEPKVQESKENLKSVASKLDNDESKLPAKDDSDLNKDSKSKTEESVSSKDQENAKEDLLKQTNLNNVNPIETDSNFTIEVTEHKIDIQPNSQETSTEDSPVDLNKKTEEALNPEKKPETDESHVPNSDETISSQEPKVENNETNDKPEIKQETANQQESSYYDEIPQEPKEITEKTNEIEPLSSLNKIIKVKKNNTFPSKFCAELKPAKDFFNDNVEIYLSPIISLLPDDMQLTLLDETKFAGLNTASCCIISTLILIILSTWYLILSSADQQKLAHIKHQNEQYLIIENNLKKSTFEKQTFEVELNELDSKLNDCQVKLIEKEEKIKHLSETNGTNANNAQIYVKDLEKVRLNEAKLQKELSATKLDLANFRDKFEMQQQDNLTQQAETEKKNASEIESLKLKLSEKESILNDNETKLTEQEKKINELSETEKTLRDDLDEKEKKVAMLQNCLLREQKVSKNALKTEDEEIVVVSNEDVPTETTESLDSVMRIAELQMEIKNLEESLENANKNCELKANECEGLVERMNEKLTLIEKLEQRQKSLEKAIKEQEMQNNLLNELREKDTKQHIKALTDLDTQLKKKSSDADKISHFLEQLRIKQERIQELESQFSRIERQANQERQTFDRQTHETWLNARKIEKELKETRIELTMLKERFSDLENQNKSLVENNNLIKGQQLQLPQAKNPLMSPLHQQYQLQQNSNSSLMSGKKSVECDSPMRDAGDVSNQIADAANSLETSQITETINKSISADQLQVDTENRPSSRASNSSGIHGQLPGIPPMGMPPFSYIRPPMPGGANMPGFRFPYPSPQMAAYMQQQQQQQHQHLNNSSSQEGSTPDNYRQNPMINYPNFQSPSMMYHRMHPMMAQQQQQYMQQMNLNTSQTMPKSNASSQQPSPTGGLNQSINNSTMLNTSSLKVPYSNTFPNLTASSNLNDSTTNNMNFNNPPESEPEDNVNNNHINLNEENSNFNV